MPQVKIWWADIKMKVRTPEHGTVLGLRLSVLNAMGHLAIQ